MGFMSAKRSATITTYGTATDQAKLRALAKLRKTTASTCLIEMIREQYAAVYGTADPETTDARA